MGSTTKRIGSVLGAQMSLVVLLIGPTLGAIAVVELTSSPESTRLAHLKKGEDTDEYCYTVP